MVASKGKLWRGSRTVANSEKSFWSPNYPEIKKETALVMPKEQFHSKLFNSKNKIIVVKVYPGMEASELVPYLNMKELHGMVLEIWGDGTGPTSPEFLKMISELAKKGVVMVAVSQYDQVGDNYETDIRLLEAGVLPGYDMTTAAAYTKLAFLLGNVEEKKLLGQLMDVNFRGEVTLNNHPLE